MTLTLLFLMYVTVISSNIFLFQYYDSIISDLFIQPVLKICYLPFMFFHYNAFTLFFSQIWFMCNFDSLGFNVILFIFTLILQKVFLKLATTQTKQLYNSEDTALLKYNNLFLEIRFNFFPTIWTLFQNSVLEYAEMHTDTHK